VAAIGKFEDIEAWQGARALVKALYEVTGQGAFARDLALRDQLRRAAVSVMSNIAEGFERDGDREFRQFLTIAKASAGEVRSLLYVALDLEYIDGEKLKSLSDQARVLSRQIARFIAYLNRRSQQPSGRSLAPLPGDR
jgi:four helix bundle protein